MKNLTLILLIPVLFFALNALAQETENSTGAVALDENVTAADLGISEPTVLPDSPFYFFKNLGRTIQSAVTFNSVKKAELRERFANEKLIELRKLAEKTQDPEVLKKATENFQREVQNVKNAVDKIKEKAEGNNEAGKFLDKSTQQSILQYTILEKLATQVPTEVLEKITEARKAHLEKFGEVMTKLENKENIQQRLEKNLEAVKGSEFKDFKNLEILKELEGKVPEAAKEAIQKAQENTLKRLQGDVGNMSSEEQTKFQDYVEKIGGVKERQMEILDSLKTELQNSPQIIQKLLQIRDNVVGQVKESTAAGNTNENVVCPQIAKPASTFCPNGRILIKKDDKGCIAAFNCVVPAETSVVPQNTQACVALWDPVCGKNGETYSNSCFAKLAGAEIASEGACKSLETGTSSQIREQIKSLAPQLTP